MLHPQLSVSLYTSEWIEILTAQLQQTEQELSSQLAETMQGLSHIEKVKKGTISLEEFNEHIVGDDWTIALEKGIEYAINNKIWLVLPDYPIKTSYIQLTEMSNIFIEFLPNSLLTPIDGLESHFLTFKKCTNVQIKDYRVDGKDQSIRGLVFLKGNNWVKINEIDIKNIRPVNKENPTNINSVGLLIASHDNHNFDIGEVYIDGIRNNNNGIIGDSIGSSRGILFDSVHENQTIPCTNVRIREAYIKNIYSEDGDGVQFAGKGEHDIEIEYVETDNTERRSLKFQGLKGVKVRKLKARQSDRTFVMAAGVSMLATGNSLYSHDIDIQAVKGIEYSPTDTSNHHASYIGVGDVTLTDDALLNGSRTYPVDLLQFQNNPIENLTIDNIRTKGRNNGVMIRGYTREVKIVGLNHYSYTGTTSAINIQKNPMSSPDDYTEEHINLSINNIDSDVLPVYIEPNVTFRNTFFVDHRSRNGSNSYESIFSHKGIKGLSADLLSNSMPDSGTFYTGDYVKNIRPSRIWQQETQNWKIIKGWLRLTNGSTHVLGTDWVEDKITVT